MMRYYRIVIENVDHDDAVGIALYCRNSAGEQGSHGVYIPNRANGATPVQVAQALRELADWLVEHEKDLT